MAVSKDNYRLSLSSDCYDANYTILTILIDRLLDSII